MPLTADEQAALARLGTFYKATRYDPQHEPGGMLNGGSRANAVPAWRDTAAAVGAAGRLVQEAIQGAEQAAGIVGAALSVMVSTWDTGTADANPGVGKVRATTPTPTVGSYALVISTTDADGANITGWLTALGASTTPTKGRLRVAQVGDRTRWIDVDVTGAPVIAAGRATVPVTYVAGSGGFAAGVEVALGCIRTGDRGATWHVAAAAPAAGTGLNGDFALNTTTGAIFQKAGGAWTATGGNLHGAVWHVAATNPVAGTGVDGDYALNSVTGDVFKRSGGAWGAAVANIRGSVWHTAGVDPAAGTGANGDLYLNTTTGGIFKKAGGAWGAAVGSIRGPAGTNGADGLMTAASNAETAAGVLTTKAVTPASAVATFLAKAGGIMGGMLNMAGHVLRSAKIQDARYSFIDKGTVSSGTVTFDATEAQVQRLQVGGSLTVAFIYLQSTDTSTLLLRIVNGGAGTITWPAAMSFVKNDGTTQVNPTRMLQSSGTDRIQVWSEGTSILAKVI